MLHHPRTGAEAKGTEILLLDAWRFQCVLTSMNDVSMLWLATCWYYPYIVRVDADDQLIALLSGGHITSVAEALAYQVRPEIM